MNEARRHFLMTLRRHLADDILERDDGHGRRAKFLLDHLEVHVAREDWRVVEDFERAMGGSTA